MSMEILSGKDMEALGGAEIPGLKPDLSERPPGGTGLYRFVERFQGEFFLMGAIDYEHWRWQPQFKEIEHKFIGEASTRLAGLLTGAIHLVQLPQDLKEQAVREGAQIARPKVFARERALFVNNLNYDTSYINYEQQNTA